MRPDLVLAAIEGIALGVVATTTLVVIWRQRADDRFLAEELEARARLAALRVQSSELVRSCDHLTTDRVPLGGSELACPGTITICLDCGETLDEEE